MVHGGGRKGGLEECCFGAHLSSVGEIVGNARQRSSELVQGLKIGVLRSCENIVQLFAGCLEPRLFSLRPGAFIGG